MFVWDIENSDACSRSSFGQSPVFAAAGGGYISCLETLIAAKADLNQRDWCVFSVRLESSKLVLGVDFWLIF